MTLESCKNQKFRAVTTVQLNKNYFLDLATKYIARLWNIFSFLSGCHHQYSLYKAKPFVILFNRHRTFVYAPLLDNNNPSKKRSALHLMTSFAIILTDRRIIASYFVFSFRSVAILQFNLAGDLVIIAILNTASSQQDRKVNLIC